MKRFEYKEEPAHFRLEPRPTTPNLSQIQESTQVAIPATQSKFAEWRPTGAEFDHSAEITWPIVCLSILSGLLAIFAPRYGQFALPCLAVLIVAILLRLERRSNRMRQLTCVELDPGDTAVEIAIAKDGIVIGRDIGFMRFEAGTLFFQGASTTFSFSRRQVSVLKPRQRGGIFYVDGLPRKLDRIRYRVGETDFELGLLPLRDTDAKEWPNYVDGVNRWIFGKVREDGVDVFPPNTVSPWTLREARSELATPFLFLFLFAFEIFAVVVLDQMHFIFSADGGWVLFNIALAVLSFAIFLAYSVLPAIRIWRRIRLAHAYGQKL